MNLNDFERHREPPKAPEALNTRIVCGQPDKILPVKTFTQLPRFPEPELYTSWARLRVFISPIDTKFISTSLDESTPSVKLNDDLFVSPAVADYLNHSRWHCRQSMEAVDSAIAAQPQAMDFIPSEIFRLNIIRSYSSPSQGDPQSSGCAAIALGVDVPPRKLNTRPQYRWTILRVQKYFPLVELRSDRNPYPQLFVELLSRLPAEWHQWLTWCRAHAGRFRWDGL